MMSIVAVHHEFIEKKKTHHRGYMECTNFSHAILKDLVLSNLPRWERYLGQQLEVSQTRSKACDEQIMESPHKDLARFS
jgi:hypothetical protein